MIYFLQVKCLLITNLLVDLFCDLWDIIESLQFVSWHVIAHLGKSTFDLSQLLFQSVLLYEEVNCVKSLASVQQFHNSIF